VLVWILAQYGGTFAIRPSGWSPDWQWTERGTVVECLGSGLSIPARTADDVGGRCQAVSVRANSSDALAQGLEISVFEHGATTTIALNGEWDLAEQEATRQAIRRSMRRQPACVVLDLSRLSFIDSSGIAVVVELFKRAERLKIELVIVPGCRTVQRIFDICQLTELLPFKSDG
jgi:anti-sigma B factor antagonist